MAAIFITNHSLKGGNPIVIMSTKCKGKLFYQVMVSDCMIDVYLFTMQVEVLPSLQRPKKIGIQGSDGRLYVMMCKPKVRLIG